MHVASHNAAHECSQASFTGSDTDYEFNHNYTNIALIIMHTCTAG